MADAIQVPVSGGIPPLPPGGSERGNTAPPAPAAQPFAPPQVPAAPAAGGFTQADIDAAVAAALAGKQATPAAQAPANVPALVPGAAVSAPAELATANDPLLTSMTSMLTTAAVGLDLNRAIGNALTHGNVALVDKAYITEKGGAQAPHLIALAEGIVNRVEAQAAEGAQAVYSLAGGEQQWTVAASAFDKGAAPHVKRVVKQMLDSGSTETAKAAAQMVLDFAKQSGIVPNKPGLIQAGAPGGGAAQGLDKLGFQAALRALKPNDPGFEQARADLFERRTLGKSLGL